MKFDEFKTAMKAAGYNRVVKISDTFFEAIDIKRGVKVLLTKYGNKPPSASISVRGHFGYLFKKDVEPDISGKPLVELVIEIAATMQGDPVKKKKTGEDRFRKIVPSIKGAQLKDGVYHRPCKIASAEVIGACQLEKSGNIVLDVSKPDTEPFFVVQCQDSRKRNLYFIVQDASYFYIALKRGKSIENLKLVATDLLFKEGSFPLSVHDITVDDLEFVMEAVELWVQSL
jgi:hypothetical protein